MAATERSVKEHFTESIRCLLEEIAPPNGAIALLLRRGDESSCTFFPISIARGKDFRSVDELMESYFLYSLYFQPDEDDFYGILDEKETGTETLIRQGKLALALFPAGPVTIGLHVCDAVNAPKHRKLLLCTLRPAPATRAGQVGNATDVGSATETFTPSFSIRQVFVS